MKKKFLVDKIPASHPNAPLDSPRLRQHSASPQCNVSWKIIEHHQPFKVQSLSSPFFLNSLSIRYIKGLCLCVWSHPFLVDFNYEEALPQRHSSSITTNHNRSSVFPSFHHLNPSGCSFPSRQTSLGLSHLLF